MITDEGISKGRALAQHHIKLRLPDATDFHWDTECGVPPHDHVDFDHVSFRVGGLLLKVRLRCEAIDEVNEDEIRSWISAQTHEFQPRRTG